MLKTSSVPFFLFFAFSVHATLEPPFHAYKRFLDIDALSERSMIPGSAVHFYRLDQQSANSLDVRPERIELEAHVEGVRMRLNLAALSSKERSGKVRLIVGFGDSKTGSHEGDGGERCSFVGEVKEFARSERHSDEMAYKSIVDRIGGEEVGSFESKVMLSICDTVTGNIRLSDAVKEMLITFRSSGSDTVAQIDIRPHEKPEEVQLHRYENASNGDRDSSALSNRSLAIPPSTNIDERITITPVLGVVETTIFLDESFIDTCHSGDVLAAVSKAFMIIEMANTFLDEIGIEIDVHLFYAFPAASGGQPWTRGSTRPTQMLGRFDGWLLPNRPKVHADLKDPTGLIVQLDAAYLLTCDPFGYGISCTGCICKAGLPVSGVIEYIERFADADRIDYASQQLAHEIGHNLNMEHDNLEPQSRLTGCGYDTCPCNGATACPSGNCIMYATADGAKTEWSSCSMAEADMARHDYAHLLGCIAPPLVGCPPAILVGPFDDPIEANICLGSDLVATLQLTTDDNTLTVALDLIAQATGYSTDPPSGGTINLRHTPLIPMTPGEVRNHIVLLGIHANPINPICAAAAIAVPNGFNIRLTCRPCTSLSAISLQRPDVAGDPITPPFPNPIESNMCLGSDLVFTLQLSSTDPTLASVDPSGDGAEYLAESAAGGTVKLRYFPSVALTAGETRVHTVYMTITFDPADGCTHTEHFYIRLTCTPPVPDPDECPAMVMTDALDAFWLRSLTYRSCYMFVRGNQDRSLDICAAVQLTGASATQYAYKAILQDAGESALLVAKVQDFGGAADPKFIHFGLEHQPGDPTDQWTNRATGLSPSFRCFFQYAFFPTPCETSPEDNYISDSETDCAYLFSTGTGVTYWGTELCSLAGEPSPPVRGYICEYPLVGNTDGTLLPRPTVNFGALSPAQIDALYTTAGAVVDV